MIVSVIVGLGTMLGPGSLASQGGSPSAIRSFNPATVEQGGQVTVTITANNYGQAGGVTRTLPAGFSYVSNRLPDCQVKVTGQEVRFTLQGDFLYLHGHRV